MSNPERPRVQAVKPAQEKVPNTTDLTHADWGRLDEVWNQPTVVDDKAKAPTMPSGTHDAAAMLDRVRAAVADPRRADQMVAHVYAGEETVARAAQVGVRESLAVHDGDVVVFPEDEEPTETGAISLLGADDDPSPPLFEDHQINDGTLQGIPTMGAVPPVPTIASPLPDNLSPTIASRDTQANPLPVAPPPNPKPSWISQTMQSMTDTIKRWGRRLGIVGALTTSTSMHVPEQLPTQSIAGNVSTEQVSQPQPSILESSADTSEFATQKQFTDTPPPNLPVAPLSGNDISNDRFVDIPLPPVPQKPTMNADRSSVSNNQPSVTDNSVATRGPQVAQVDNLVSQEPLPSSVIQQSTSVENAKQLNVDLNKGTLSPERQIEYLEHLFETLDTSKIFIRLSPTKRLELRQSSDGEITARFPGAQDFQPFTAEDVTVLGKDLHRLPHYTR